ncbi:hypothetical protein [Streptomyces sp. CB03238]|uniref:hypothetical protein n=1 Tax=Streptomyces sp. CB03238 TaxID=1907777 RepID=UPI000A0F9960|nr:hypothetical protein [Streptomyces sp. CB03238]ORT55629.1 hypothetical protein BKD26_31495 [Streptomyces sp. CB03238]
MTELKETRQQLERLDDPAIGLTALHREITQCGRGIQEAVQTGSTELRDENREVRRRQDRMIKDLNETRAELRHLLDLADTLRALVLPQYADPSHDVSPEASPHQPPGASWTTTGHRPEPRPTVTALHHHTEAGTDQQGETMENTDQQRQPEAVDDDQDLALKRAIEAAYHGTQATAQASPTAPQTSGGGLEDPQVAHGVLLLKAAGVASAELVAHRDTWEWLAALAVDHDHFRTPPAVEDIKEGRVQTVLSGRSLIALLIKLWSTRSTATPLDANWALATTAYNRIAAELANVTGRGETIRIVLDDGLPDGADD